MKKILAGISALVLSVGLVGCGNQSMEINSDINYEDVSEESLLIDTPNETEEGIIDDYEIIDEESDVVVESKINESETMEEKETKDIAVKLDSTLTGDVLVSKALSNITSKGDGKGYNYAIIMDLSHKAEGVDGASIGVKADLNMQVQNGVVHLLGTIDVEGEDSTPIECYIVENTDKNSISNPTIAYMLGADGKWSKGYSEDTLNDAIIEMLFTICGEQSQVLMNLVSSESFLSIYTADVSTGDYVLDIDMKDKDAEQELFEGKIKYVIDSDFRFKSWVLDNFAFKMNIGTVLKMGLNMQWNVTPLGEGVTVTIPNEVIKKAK